VNLIDILRWVYENTVQSTWDGLHHWATESLTFQQKIAAFYSVDWKDDEQLLTSMMMKQIVRKCFESDMTELTKMYGVLKVLKTVAEIYLTRYQQCNDELSIELHNAALKRLRDYRGKKERLS
jgi:hypothetical protein